MSCAESCSSPSTVCWIRRSSSSLRSAAAWPRWLISAPRCATASTTAARLAATEEVCSSSRVVVLVSATPVACRSSTPFCARVFSESRSAATASSCELDWRAETRSRSRATMRRKLAARSPSSSCVSTSTSRVRSPSAIRWATALSVRTGRVTVRGRKTAMAAAASRVRPSTVRRPRRTLAAVASAATISSSPIRASSSASFSTGPTRSRSVRCARAPSMIEARSGSCSRSACQTSAVPSRKSWKAPSTGFQSASSSGVMVASPYLASP